MDHARMAAAMRTEVATLTDLAGMTEVQFLSFHKSEIPHVFISA